MKNKIKYFHSGVFIILIFSLFIFIPRQTFAAAASLYLTPSSGTYVINSTFKVSVKINTGGEPVNAAEGSISYDANLLSVSSISKAGSIFNLWPTEPADKGGTVSFEGGIPHPGYKGSSGAVISIIFKAKKSGSAQIRFTSGAVLANDGLGTNILASMGSGSYTIAPKEEPPKPVKEKPTQTQPEEKKPSEPQLQPDRLLPNIFSLTHPDGNFWYQNKDISFKWDLPASVIDTSFIFDKEAGTIPDNTGEGLLAEKDYLGTLDGVWYLHLKFKDKEGWGSVGHYRARIDNTSPLPFVIQAEQKDAGDWPTLLFEAKDELSGVVGYEVKIDVLDGAAGAIDPAIHTFKVSGLSVGKHTVIIKARDAAGNEAFSEGEFMIAALESPVIVDYLSEVMPGDKIFISGTAIADAKITLTINADNFKRIFMANSDSAGNWFIAADANLSKGGYYAWAEAENSNGIKSQHSAIISFMVTSPILARFGNFIINYFTVFVSLIFLILLIILMIIFLIWLYRKKLRRETVEIEDVLQDNLAGLEKEINDSLIAVEGIKSNSELKKAIALIKADLNGKIENSQKKILKEVNDVEKILN